MRDNMTVEIRRMSASALAATDAESSPEARAECLERALHRISDIDEDIFPGNVWGLKAYSDSALHDYDHLIAAFGTKDAKDEALIGFALMGAGCSAVYPLAVSAAAQRTDRPAAVNVAALGQVSFVVFFLAPPLLGFVAESMGIRMSYLICVPILLAGLVASAMALSPRKTEAPVSAP